MDVQLGASKPRVVASSTKMERLRRFLGMVTGFIKSDREHNLLFLFFFLSCHGNSVLLTMTMRFNRTGGSKGEVVRVYIVRHGETQENRDGIIQGHRDTFLNAIGLEQARMVGEALKDAKLGIAFSSDLSRAVKVRGSD